MNETKFTTDGNALTITRLFDTSLDLVWRAWTEAELLDQWWAPKPWQSVTKSMDFKEGGKRLYAMRGPEGEEHWGLTTYTTIVKHESFSGEDAFADETGKINEAFPVSTFQTMLKKKGNQTLVVNISKYASEEALKQTLEMGLEEGLSKAYENLDHCLAALK